MFKFNPSLYNSTKQGSSYFIKHNKKKLVLAHNNYSSDPLSEKFPRRKKKTRK